MMHRRFAGRLQAGLGRGAGLLVIGLVVVGCRDQNKVTVPNRALDRPTDIALACVRISEGTVEPQSLEQCHQVTRTGCSDELQLIGFLTNSERNEIAMFRRCDRDSLVDLDPDVSGYQFLPAGQLPQRLMRTSDSCLVASANTQSCDVTLVDVQSAAGLAFDADVDSRPGSVVSTVHPTTGSGRPLATRIGAIVAVPNHLSNASPPSQDDAGDTDGIVGPTCGGNKAYSAYVTFPTCQLVAELDLRTGRVLQGRQFVRSADGTFEVIDTGPEPMCPVDCPASFDGPIPDLVLDGMSPMALELAARPVLAGDEQPVDAAEAAFIDQGYDALFVGGNGSPFVFEIPIAENGDFADAADITSLMLDDPEGVKVVRVTPPMLVDLEGAGQESMQFLYVVAGDGSTRVVKRDFIDFDILGVECDTQVDPTEVFLSACHEIDPLAPTTSPDRSPLAIGPGIRAPGGSAITDWTFQKVVGSGPEPEEGTAAFGRRGVVGIGVTSFGRIVLSIFDQVSGASFVSAVDPLGIMNTQLQPHMLWPEIDPQSLAVPAFPRLRDQEPQRLVGEQGTAVLAPSLRRIDLAYTAEVEGSTKASAERDRIAAALGNPGNIDALGTFDFEEGTDFYKNGVARIVARDYRRWPQNRWELIWEGVIPGTPNLSGRVQCDLPGWEGGTCLAPPAHYVPPDKSAGPCDAGQACAAGSTCDVALGRCVFDCPSSGSCADIDSSLACDEERGGCRLSDMARQSSSRLVDEGASFCDHGVLAGDKLVIVGCDDDQDCGSGRRCLLDPSTTGGTGICVSEATYDADRSRLRQVCAPFISDPCGEVRREYVVTRATQEELSLQAMDIRPTSYLRDAPQQELPPPADDPKTPDPENIPTSPVEEHIARLSCELPQNGQGDPLEQPDGGCDTDEECQMLVQGGQDPDPSDAFGLPTYVCVEGRCRAPCDSVGAFLGHDACRKTALPGPTCFPEFVSYQVRLRNSFLVSGNPVASFLTDRVIVDPVTGDCVEDESVSPLLTSRLWLGADEAETFGHPTFKIADCQSQEPSSQDTNPCRITADRTGAGGSQFTKFHAFSYYGKRVEAVRFTNPYLSLTLDLSSLLGLTGPVPDSDRFWRDDLYCAGPDPVGGCAGDPARERAFWRFQRARIPENYRETFDTLAGYDPIDATVAVLQTRLIYPMRVINAPELGVVFVVDAGGLGGNDPRGRVMRVELTPEILADQFFRVF